jgi:tellurium resistance protein TerD
LGRFHHETDDCACTLSRAQQHQLRAQARQGVEQMAVSLSKGGNVSLTKEAGSAGLAHVSVALGWKVRTTTGVDFDLDASADSNFVFYGNLDSPEGAVHHTGDNLVGGGDDDEVIEVNLTKVPETVSRIVFPVSIYGAEEAKQNFGQVSDAYIRVVNAANGKELARYDLTEEASSETAMVFGELYHLETEWKFRAVGQGYASGLAGIARDYGVSVA